MPVVDGQDASQADPLTAPGLHGGDAVNQPMDRQEIIVITVKELQSGN